MLTNLRESFRANMYAIVTALVIAVGITGYILVVIPIQKNNEDQRNQAVFQNIQQQLLGYVDDQVKAISEKGIGSGVDKKGNKFKVLANTAIDTSAVIRSVKTTGGSISSETGIVIMKRTVYYEYPQAKGKIVKDSLKDTVKVNVSRFIQQISPLKKFSAFYIGKIEKEKDAIKYKLLVEENVTLTEQDSLLKHYREERVQVFSDSHKRYYTAQLPIAPGLTVYMAAGLDNNAFDSAVRSVSPGLLIFSLLVITLLVLSLSLIKPVLSSYKERMSQRDFVSVAFSIGALIGVLVAFGGVTGWRIVLKDKNDGDLRKLVNQVSVYFNTTLDNYEKDSAKIVRSKHGFFKLKIDGNNLNYYRITDSAKVAASIPKAAVSSFDRLEEYFTMDSTGLITSNYNKEFPGIRRIYKDRGYFRMLKEPGYKKVLTTVLSRSDHKYQWIYAKDDGRGGLSGLAFRDNLNTEITVPPGTDFLIVNNKGNILFQNEPGKVLRGNLIEGTSNESELMRLLAGNNEGAFTTEYQGVKYQMYGHKLIGISDNPVYVIAMRDLRFQENLSLFSFSNTFLLTLLYGIFIMLLMMAYSATLRAGEISVFSRQHLAYLFPSNNRTAEYKWLFVANGLIILLITFGSFLMPYATAVWVCLIAGVNMAFLNFASLNNDHFHFSLLRNVLLLWLIPSAIASLMLMFHGHLILACVLTFGLHFGWIAAYKKKIRLKKPLKPINEGINRKDYSRFFTIVLLKHFGLLPLVLCSMLYLIELNDFSTWYCASPQGACRIEANGCGCEPNPETKLDAADNFARYLDIHLLNRPVDAQLEGFSFAAPRTIHYVKTMDVLHSLSNFSIMIVIVLFLISMYLIFLLAKGLSDYYSNRFFFYALMQAGFEHYYPGGKTLPMKVQWPCKYLPKPENAKSAANPEILDAAAPDKQDATAQQAADQENTTPVFLFAKDGDNQLWNMHREEFYRHENLREFKWEYQKVWDKVPVTQRYVLFDFSRDHFVNYKNRDILMELMEQGIIDCDPVTGRLKVTNEAFRAYIVQTYRKDPKFIAEFKNESKDGFFMKLRLPLIIIAVSLLVLLIYLNKNGFDNLFVFGTTITTALGFVNKFMGSDKPAV